MSTGAADPAVPEPAKKLKANATYTEMITAAILDLNDRTGSSTPAITSWIAKHYPKLKVKQTTVGSKIRPLVQSGYLVRAKSSFKLSASTRDQMRKAKVAKVNKANNKKKEAAGAARKDRGLDQISRVRKHLGLLPLVSNHHVFDDLTQIVKEHAVAPVKRDAAIAADRPKKKRRTGGEKKAQPATTLDPSATAELQSGDKKGTSASMMRGSSRAKSSYNFYQDSVKAAIRKEQPGISMPDLRKVMMARWNAMSTEEKEPFEAQGAAAKEVFSQMQAGAAAVANTSAVLPDASPVAGSTPDETLAASVDVVEDERAATTAGADAAESLVAPSVAAMEGERASTTGGADAADPSLAVQSVGSIHMRHI